MDSYLQNLGIVLALIAILFVIVPVLSGGLKGLSANKKKEAFVVILGIAGPIGVISLLCIFYPAIKEKLELNRQTVEVKIVPESHPIEKQVVSYAEPAIDPTPETKKKFDDVCQLALQKVKIGLAGSQMDGDLSLTQESYFDRTQPTVRVTAKLLSLDAINSFKDGSLRKQVYHSFELIYKDTFIQHGFSNAIFTIDTDFK